MSEKATSSKAINSSTTPPSTPPTKGVDTWPSDCDVTSEPTKRHSVLGYSVFIKKKKKKKHSQEEIEHMQWEKYNILLHGENVELEVLIN